MAETLLVTGGAGFIGCNFIRMLLRESDYRVINLDALTYAGNLESLRDVEDNGRYQFVRGDICNAELLDYILGTQELSGIINFAAETHVDRSILDAGPFVHSNISGTVSLLEAVRRHGVRRYLQISTDEVYGSLGAEGRFSESSPLKPNSPYAASKAAADVMIFAYAQTHDLDVVITRCSNNFGPYQFPEKLIPLMILNALEDQPLPVYGDGTNVRDWIHVDDHCRAIRQVFERGRSAEVYNIGASCEMSNIDTVKAILALLGKPESLIRFVTDRPGHDQRYAVDAGKIKRELGWEPQSSFGKALADIVGWYRQNPSWAASVRSGAYRNYYATQYQKRLN